MSPVDAELNQGQHVHARRLTRRRRCLDLGLFAFDLELEKSNTTIAHRIGEGVTNHDPHFQISWIHG
jgi:hypothetical protein